MVLRPENSAFKKWLEEEKKRKQKDYGSYDAWVKAQKGKV